MIIFYFKFDHFLKIIKFDHFTEVKGSKKAVLKRGFSIDSEQATQYGDLSKQMNKLVANELFADVFFEVEGKRVPAHRNILSSRSDYFSAMLSSAAHFRESNKQSPIYIPNVKYEVFIQVLSFLYTGYVDFRKLSIDILDLIRTADLFNLIKLEELILNHIGKSFHLLYGNQFVPNFHLFVF